MATRLKPNFGDTAEKDMRWAELNLRRRLVDAAARRAQGVRTTFSSACRSFGRREVLRRVVVQTADTSGLVRLASGRRLLLPPLRRFGNRIVEGARVRVVAHGGPVPPARSRNAWLPSKRGGQT